MSCQDKNAGSDKFLVCGASSGIQAIAAHKTNIENNHDNGIYLPLKKGDPHLFRQPRNRRPSLEQYDDP